MVAASQPLACDAGVSILKSGGNAVDAATAVAGMLAVTGSRFAQKVIIVAGNGSALCLGPHYVGPIAFGVTS